MGEGEIDDGFFPAPRILMGASVVLAIVGIVLALTAKPIKMVPPVNFYGCYTALGGPKIEILKTTLVVLQAEPIKASSSLKNLKGWKFEIDRWLEIRGQGDRFEIAVTNTNGQYLPLSYEEQATGQVPQFPLYNREGNLVVTYRRTGDRCN